MEQDRQAFLLDHIIELLIGFFATLVLGFIVDKILVNINKEFDRKKSEYMPGTELDGHSIFNIPSPKGSAFLGEAERALFYFSWFIFPQMIIGWFLFKVASKWEVWNNIYRFPETLEPWTKIQSLSARIWLGARTYQRFLIGAILNILVSMAGFAISIFLAANSIDPWGGYLLLALIIFYLAYKSIKMQLREEISKT